jgi:hypothetical protein
MVEELLVEEPPDRPERGFVAGGQGHMGSVRSETGEFELTVERGEEPTGAGRLPAQRERDELFPLVGRAQLNSDLLAEAGGGGKEADADAELFPLGDRLPGQRFQARLPSRSACLTVASGRSTWKKS